MINIGRIKKLVDWISSPWTGGSGSHQNGRRDRTVLFDGDISSPVYSRIVMDVVQNNFVHAKTNDGQYMSTIQSELKYCLGIQANVDQTGSMLIEDIVSSMFDDGVVAIVPIEWDDETGEIFNLRVAKIVGWHPSTIDVEVYNDQTGKRETIYEFPKARSAIISNPLYNVMNAPNGTLSRLKRKMSLLDEADEKMASGKLDLIVQLPYLLKTKARIDQAEERRKDIENQLAGSQYGIAYIDGTEKVTQLNRPVENNLMSRIEYLANEFYFSLGITKGIMDGSASESEMINYKNRTIMPIVSAICEGMTVGFLEKEKIKDGERIVALYNAFEFVPSSQIGDIADKLTRNEILSSNEVRSIIGFGPSDDPKADKLINKNIKDKNTNEEET